MLRGRTKSLAVETTHINDILRVRDIKNCFNESLFNCLSFSRSKFVNLPHCRQHCHIHPRLHCIRNPSFEFWSHQTPASSHPPSRNSSFAIQGPSFEIQAGAGFIKLPWRVHASFVTFTFTESILATSTLHPRPIGGIRCARRAITFMLYTYVANDGRE